jgi:hypothetical protein
MILKPRKDFFLLNNTLNEQLYVEFIFTTRTLFFSADTSLYSTYFKYKFYTYKTRILKHRVVKSSTTLKLKLRGLELEFSLFTQHNYCKTLKSKNFLKARTYIPFMYIVQYVHIVLKFRKNLTKKRFALLCNCFLFYSIYVGSDPRRNRLSYRSARLQRLAELVPWNRFLGSLKGSGGPER